jgi:hypothetical protein
MKLLVLADLHLEPFDAVGVVTIVVPGELDDAQVGQSRP